ncbi:M-phase phosphoprotein 8 isoform X1 [Lethenteron reissneri]|uniref:M-phase phosphoprotein 8 isoform X1 n=1 Tax=Lethenteron reissneri TaxID=7753 RepID=UPI002AB5E590|nr:M-phase phosphoprotein 8 isoform X1 [Lethenteron reissneri]
MAALLDSGSSGGGGDGDNDDATAESARDVDEEGEEEEEEKGEYEVESIVDTRTFEGEQQFRVRWRGYSPEEDTWEPKENLGGCEELLQQFYHNRKALKLHSANDSVTLSHKKENKSEKKNETLASPGKSHQQKKRKKRKKEKSGEKAKLRDEQSSTDQTSASKSKSARKHHHKSERRHKSEKRSKSKHRHHMSQPEGDSRKHCENAEPAKKSAVVREKQLERLCPSPEEGKSDFSSMHHSNHNTNSKKAMEIEATCAVVKIERLSDNEEYLKSYQSDKQRNNNLPGMRNVSVKVELDWEGSVTSDTGSVIHHSGGMPNLYSQEIACEGGLQNQVVGLMSPASEYSGISPKYMQSKYKKTQKLIVGCRKLVVLVYRLKLSAVEGNKPSEKPNISVPSEYESVQAGVSKVPVKSLCGEKLADSKCLPNKENLEDGKIKPKKRKMSPDVTNSVESDPELHKKRHKHKHKHKAQYSIEPKKSKKVSSADTVCEMEVDVTQQELADETQGGKYSSDENKALHGACGSSLQKLQESLNLDLIHNDEMSSSEESILKNLGENPPSGTAMPSPPPLDGVTCDTKTQALKSVPTAAKQQQLPVDSKPRSSDSSLLNDVIGDLQMRPCEPKARPREEMTFDCLSLEQLRRRLFEECVNAAAMAPCDASGVVGMGELREAVRTGDMHTVRAALTTQLHQVDHEDGTGMTLVMLAAAFGHLDILRLLIRSGANVNARQKNGSTALIHAAEKNHLSTLALLLENGARVNLQQNNGETALSKACKRGDVEMVRLLLDNFADCSAMLVQQSATQAHQKLYSNQIISEMIANNRQLLSSAALDKIQEYFEEDVKLLDPLFPMTCHRVGDGCECSVQFEYEPADDPPAGSSTLLFLVHSSTQGCERIACRLTGACAVQAVVLNQHYQLPLFLKNNFVFSFNPVSGTNSLLVRFSTSPALKQVNVMVCAHAVSLNG